MALVGSCWIARAGEGWDVEGCVPTPVTGGLLDVRLLLNDDTTDELRIPVVEAGADRRIKGREPIPADY
jgi:hypothetical protein